MARFKIECCKDCVDRHPACHSHCERYQTERAELDETLAEKQLERNVKIGLSGELYDTIYKTNKRLHYRSKYRRSR